MITSDLGLALLTHWVNTLRPGEAWQGREGDVSQRRLRPQSLARVWPVVGRLGFGQRSDHPPLAFVIHVTVVVNVELVVTNDALLVRSFLLDLWIDKCFRYFVLLVINLIYSQIGCIWKALFFVLWFSSTNPQRHKCLSFWEVWSCSEPLLYPEVGINLCLKVW